VYGHLGSVDRAVGCFGIDPRVGLGRLVIVGVDAVLNGSIALVGVVP
jgi:hypothetical protein